MQTMLKPVPGFLFSSIHAGFKKKKKDLSLIYCPEGAICAATFTTNLSKAAPVIFSEHRIQAATPIKAVVINSGNANACTGIRGHEDANKTANLIAELLGISTDEVLLSSTGVIGVPMPMEAMKTGLPKAVSSLDPISLADVAEGIMTTDTMQKTFSKTILLPSTGQEATLCGIAKGSGMIHPNMATMLSFLMTDVAIDQATFKKLTSSVVDDTFNMVTVDGDTSTNDMFLAMASGALGNPCINEDSSDYPVFAQAFLSLAKALAISIAQDGEGASKLLTVQLKGAATIWDARALAKSVVSSSLVKAAFFGNDANWGRILCALGYAGIPFDPTKVTLSLKSSAGLLHLMEKGHGLDFDEAFALRVLKQPSVIIDIELQEGTANAEAWGCDLTYEYVRINGAYRT